MSLRIRRTPALPGRNHQPAIYPTASKRVAICVKYLQKYAGIHPLQERVSEDQQKFTTSRLEGDQDTWPVGERPTERNGVALEPGKVESSIHGAEQWKSHILVATTRAALTADVSMYRVSRLENELTPTYRVDVRGGKARGGNNDQLKPAPQAGWIKRRGQRRRPIRCASSATAGRRITPSDIAPTSVVRHGRTSQGERNGLLGRPKRVTADARETKDG